MRRLVRLMVVCVLLGTGLVVLSASPVAALDIEVTDCDDDGFVQALFEVQNEGGGTITFDCGPDPVTITLDGEQVISPTTLGIVIDGGGLVTLSGGNATRLFFVDASASLELRNIVLTEGNGNGTPPIGRGGAIYNDGGQVVITASTLSGNQVEDLGGAIFNSDGEVTITSSTLSENQVEDSGGVIFNSDGEVTITSSTLSGNQVEDSGGVIYNLGGEVTITASTLSGNQVEDSGGVIFNDSGENDSGQVTITSSTLSGNEAGDDGGAIYNDFIGEVTITSSTLSGNEAGGDGGAVYDDLGRQVTITNSTLSGNAADGHGGAIDSFVGDTITITGSTFSGNDAPEGAAIYMHSSSIGENAITFHSSIIDGGESSAPACAVESGETLESQGYNLSSDDSCHLDPTLGDLPNTDPQLAALDDNGGPTLTHLPLPGSPVIDHIPAAECATDGEGAILPDQRGVPRPQNGLCDIGSVEVLASYLLCADRATGEVREATGSGCGRREQEIALVENGASQTFCANHTTGELRLVSTVDACTRYEQALVLPDDGPVTVCVHRSTGALRVPTSDGCTRYEFRREIGGSAPAA